jgi:hypothetical protein
MGGFEQAEGERRGHREHGGFAGVGILGDRREPVGIDGDPLCEGILRQRCNPLTDLYSAGRVRAEAGDPADDVTGELARQRSGPRAVAAAENRVDGIRADRLDFDQHLAVGRDRLGHLFELKDFRATVLVVAHCAHNAVLYRGRHK